MRDRRHIVITGGAGFIGANAVKHFARRGWDVTVLDNLSRQGASDNLEWLRHQINFAFEKIDIRDAKKIEQAFGAQHCVDVVLHLAAQVAVTNSVVDPRTDFEINALGTLNILEALREHHPEAFVINASTNKVYGKMDDVAVHEDGDRWRYTHYDGGISETYPLDFHSPYGCSKGAAERYVADYCRIYGLPTVSFRQSCIYGPRQFGIEDQGWLAWFIIATLTSQPLTIYGDGKQVRDALYVDDLLAAYEAAIDAREDVAGRAFNMGGGPANTISLLELLAMIEDRMEIRPMINFDAERPGDQKVYISNIERAQKALDWQPHIQTDTGVDNLINWITANKGYFQPG